MACVKAAQIRCLYKITIAKITCVIWKFTSPVIERLRLHSVQNEFYGKSNFIIV